MSRIPIPILALVTDRTRLSPLWTLAQAVAPAVTGGASMVILREADLPCVPRRALARFVMDAIRGRVPLLISGDVGLAIEIGAQGVFVEDPELAIDAREKIGNDGILGVALTSPESIKAAESAFADFVLVNLDWTDTRSAIENASRFRALTSISLIVGIDLPLEAISALPSVSGIAIMEPGMSAYNRTEAVRAYADELRISGGGTFPE